MKNARGVIFELRHEDDITNAIKAAWTTYGYRKPLLLIIDDEDADEMVIYAWEPRKPRPERPAKRTKEGVPPD